MVPLRPVKCWYPVTDGGPLTLRGQSVTLSHKMDDIPPLLSNRSQSDRGGYTDRKSRSQRKRLRENTLDEIKAVKEELRTVFVTSRRPSPPPCSAASDDDVSDASSNCCTSQHDNNNNNSTEFSPFVKVQIKLHYKSSSARDKRGLRRSASSSNLLQRCNVVPPIATTVASHVTNTASVRRSRSMPRHQARAAGARSLLWRISDAQLNGRTNRRGAREVDKWALDVPVKFDDSNIFMRRLMLAEGGCSLVV